MTATSDTRRAWLLASADTHAEAPSEINGLKALLEAGLSPDHAMTARVMPLTERHIEAALLAAEAFPGDAVIWLRARSVTRALGNRFLRTNDPGEGYVTLEALLRRLGECGRRKRPHCLMAVMDVSPGLPSGLEYLFENLKSSLICLAAPPEPVDGSDGFLTRCVMQALRGEGSQNVDGTVTVETVFDSVTHMFGRHEGLRSGVVLMGRSTYGGVCLNQIPTSRATVPSHRPLRFWLDFVRRQRSAGLVSAAMGDGRRADAPYVDLSIVPDPSDAPRDQTSLRHLMQADDRGAARWHIVGEAGAGKTTSARWLAEQLARDYERDRIVPVYLSLSACDRKHPFDAAEDFLSRARSASVAKGLSEALLQRAEKGEVCLLLDGLDEVGADAGANVRAAVVQWATDLSRTPIAVFGRPLGEANIPGFGVARIARLSSWQQTSLIEQRLDENHADELQAWLDRHEQLRVFATNPLILSLLTLLIEHGKPLTDSPKAILGEAIDVLLAAPTRYSREKPMSHPEVARRALGALSLALREDGCDFWTEPVVRRELGVIFSDDRYTDVVAAYQTAERFMGELGRLCGVFGRFGEGGTWRFLHATLHEFLAAEHLVASPGRFEHVVLTKRWTPSLADRWGGVLGMACALSKHPPTRFADLRVTSTVLALHALPFVEFGVVEGLRTFGQLASGGDFVDHAERLRYLAFPSAQADPDGLAVLDGLPDDLRVDEAAVVYYVLRCAGIRFADEAFFERIGRRMRTAASLRRIEGGRFLMGSPEGDPMRDPAEVPHDVWVSPFEISKTPVTLGEYRQFDPQHPQTGSASHPVTGVTWYAATLYAAWRGCVLPTEAEWEYACRAHTTTRFHCGDDWQRLERVSWYYEESVQEVARKQPNGFDLYDMHGNVHEWCCDWFGTYVVTDARDPVGPRSGRERVVRGGSVIDEWGAVRSAARARREPHIQDRYVGFRLARRTMAAYGSREA